MHQIDRGEIYPREGMETLRFARRPRYSSVEIYPREGTETRTRHRADQPAAVEIYPREGTETKLHGLHLHAVWLKFIPVRGRKPSCSIQIIMCNN